MANTRVTLITADKGGDCKTTTAIFLTSQLKEMGYKPLLIDYEGSGHASFAFGLDWRKFPTMYHVLNGEKTLEEVVTSTEFGDIIAGNDSIDLIDSLYSRVTFMEAAFKFREQISKLKQMGKWTHIIVDTQPLIHSRLPVQSVMAADDIVVPMQASIFSVQSFSKTWDSIMQAKNHNKALRVAGILLCRYANTLEERNHKETIQNWCKVKGMTLFENPIRASVAVSVAQGRQVPLIKVAKSGKPTLDYLAFVQEYLAQEGWQEDITDGEAEEVTLQEAV